MNKKLLKRLIIIGIIVVLAIYVGVQIFNMFQSGIATETAVRASVTDSLRAEGLIIRKETVLKNDKDGVISYAISDGAKIAKDGTIASIYTSPEAAATESKRMELTAQLEKLQSLNKIAGTSAVNPDNVNKQIYQKLYSLKANVNEFSLSDIAANRDDILNLINQWQLATGKIKTFSDRIKAVKSEIAALSDSSGKSTGSITASKAGYFIKNVDGYESVYDYDDVRQLTVEDLQKEQEPKEVGANVIGKVCEQFDWYVACVVPADTAVKLKVDDEMTIRMPFVSNVNIPATVVAVNQPNVESEAALVLQCSFMDATLADIRQETVLLNIDDFDGIRISQNAVHFETLTRQVTDKDGNTSTETKEVRGVYVVDGSELKFVQIEPVYTTGNYLICDPSPDMDTLMTDDTIALYDTVAIGGNLYDGKPVG